MSVWDCTIEPLLHTYGEHTTIATRTPCFFWCTQRGGRRGERARFVYLYHDCTGTCTCWVNDSLGLSSATPECTKCRWCSISGSFLLQYGRGKWVSIGRPKAVVSTKAHTHGSPKWCRQKISTQPVRVWQTSTWLDRVKCIVIWCTWRVWHWWHKIVLGSCQVCTRSWNGGVSTSIRKHQAALRAFPDIEVWHNVIFG